MHAFVSFQTDANYIDIYCKKLNYAENLELLIVPMLIWIVLPVPSPFLKVFCLIQFAAAIKCWSHALRSLFFEVLCVILSPFLEDNLAMKLSCLSSYSFAESNDPIIFYQWVKISIKLFLFISEYFDFIMLFAMELKIFLLAECFVKFYHV